MYKKIRNEYNVFIITVMEYKQLIVKMYEKLKLYNWKYFCKLISTEFINVLKVLF